MTFYFIESNEYSTLNSTLNDPILELTPSNDILVILKKEVIYQNNEIKKSTNKYNLFALTPAKAIPARFNKMQFRDYQNKEINFKDINDFIKAFNKLSKTQDSGDLKVVHKYEEKFLKTEIVVIVIDLDKLHITNEDKNI